MQRGWIKDPVFEIKFEYAWYTITQYIVAMETCLVF